MTMLRLSRADAVIVQGTLCAVARINPHVVELRPLGGEAPPMSLSHLELMGQLSSGNCEMEYGYFGSRQAARRAMAGRSLLSLLPSAEQQLVFWKIDWCETFLAAEASGEVSRSDQSCSAFISELEKRVIENDAPDHEWQNPDGRDLQARPVPHQPDGMGSGLGEDARSDGLGEEVAVQRRQCPQDWSRPRGDLATQACGLPASQPDPCSRTASGNQC